MSNSANDTAAAAAAAPAGETRAWDRFLNFFRQVLPSGGGGGESTATFSTSATDVSSGKKQEGGARMSSITDSFMALWRSNEAKRVENLEWYGIVEKVEKNTISGTDFEAVAKQAREMFGTSISIVSLNGKGRQYFLSKTTDYSKEVLSCNFAMSERIVKSSHVKSILVKNAKEDNVYGIILGRHGISFYAGAAIVSSEGHKLGTVSVMDKEPINSISTKQFCDLEDLGTQVMEYIASDMALENFE